MKPIQIISDPGNVFRISYMVSNYCNYKCDYCFPGSNEGTHSYNKDWQLVSKNMKYLFEYYKIHSMKQRFDINITGGEPTLWPDLGKFCNEIKDDNVMISLQTNGSRTLRWWEENGHLFTKVLMSAHHKEIDVEHFAKVADTLYEQQVFVVVTVCMDPNNWDKCIELIDKLKSSGKHRWYMRLQKLEGDYTYTEEQTKFLKSPVVQLPNLAHAWQHRRKFYNKESKVEFDNGKIIKMSSHEISLNKWNNFYGWKCNLGVDSVFIDLNGNITGSCQQKIYNKNEYYNIYDIDFTDNFKPVIAPVTCRQLGCYCVPEINMAKKIL